MPLPVVFFTPETRWAFGATANYNFRFITETDTSRASQALAGFAYTQEKQLLVYLPFQLFWDDARYYSFGEFGYYKYFYNFYGIGDDTPIENEEVYTVDYPRIRLNFTRKVAPNWYLGGQYWFEDYAVKETLEGGLLAAGNVPGGAGGLVSGYGLITAYDTRDRIYFPAKGTYFESVIHANPKALGSDFDYVRFGWDIHQYYSLKWGHIVALNAWGEHVSDGAPFHLKALLGGTKRLRGYYQGRYMDNNSLILQAEYRMPLFWRFGLAVFGGTGTVAPGPSGLISGGKWHPAGGAGLRVVLNKEEHLNVRLDMGFTPEGSAFYLTFGEAF